MDDKDRVFARFKTDKPEPSDRRELLNIPRRAGGSGSRVVEVVHIRSDAALKDRPRRLDPHVRAASWEGGFPARQAAAPRAPSEPSSPAAPEPMAHVMPAWESAANAPPAAAATGAPRPVRRGPARPRDQALVAPLRHVADPFDAADDGANCMRCGYAVEPARERRGLMTCAACG